MTNTQVRFPSFHIISYYTGYIIFGIAVLMGIPLITSLLMAEWNPALDFVISMSVSVIIGLLMMLLGRRTRTDELQVDWKFGFIIAALSWIMLMFLCSIP
ncbi:MAG: TrkH family potassium uptake protein, partial [Clostridiales bacterium]|nr:TrkH family potassium uptake protein [Clostridiales bacterium]